MCHKLRQMALGSQTPGVFASNWEVSEVTNPHVAPHLACSESKSCHTPDDKEKCFWYSRKHLQWGSCGPQALQSENLIPDITQREGQEGGPSYGR